VNVVERENERCGKYTKLYPEECCEPIGEGEYKDDDGQVYVVRRLLRTPKANCETTYNLFRTRSMLNQQIFYLIIDNGRYENIIGRETLVKLGLNIEIYRAPYSIGWIKKVPKVTITER
jgi:hypothetical protein